MMSWSQRYVGIPYADLGRDRGGCDCWGLARLVYAEELDITLPSYAGDYISAEEMQETAALIADHKAEVWHKAEDARPFDLLLFRQGRHASHIGIHVQPGLMLHVQGDDQAKIESYRTPRWSLRLTGAYRHAKQPFNGAAA